MGVASGPVITKASDLATNAPNAVSGKGAIRPNGASSAPIQVNIDVDTAGGPWIHVGTIYDNNEDHQNSAHVWSSGFNATQDTGLWENSSTLGTAPTFTDDWKSEAWNTVEFGQILIKDSGATQRNLLYTNSGQITSNNSSLAAWFASLDWLTNGSETSTSAYSNSRVTGLSITNFSVADPILDSGNKSVLLFKFGERDGVQDTNKDRSMIAWHRHNQGDNVDAPAGIGTFANRSSPGQEYRDITPYALKEDAPPASITGGPYAVSIWIK
jgi:hypothetical protein